MSKASIVLAGICLVSINGGLANGEIVAYDFTGLLNAVEDPNGVLDPSVVVGGPFTTRLWYDTGTAIDTRVERPSLGLWHIPDGGISAMIGSMTFDTTIIAATVMNEGYADEYIFADQFFSCHGLEDLLVGITLLDYSGLAIDSDALPSGPIDLSAFPDMRRFELVENLPGMRIEGEITSITFIPEPSAALCLLGLATALVRRQRLVPGR